MQIIDFWGIIRIAASYVNDLVVICGLIGSLLLLLGSIIAVGRDDHRVPVWFQRWDMVIISLVLGSIGLVAKLHDPVPHGVIFRFNNLTVVILLFVTFLVSIWSIWLRNRAWSAY